MPKPCASLRMDLIMKRQVRRTGTDSKNGCDRMVQERAETPQVKQFVQSARMMFEHHSEPAWWVDVNGILLGGTKRSMFYSAVHRKIRTSSI